MNDPSANRPARQAPARVVALLAGGASSRMGGRDKALARLAGARLVDHALARLGPQADRLVISGPHDYGTGLPCVPDSAEGPRGPVAGIFSLWRWVEANAAEARGFFTAPVDGPFAPPDLVARLAEAGGPAIAADPQGSHPVFAYWTCAALAQAWPAAKDAPSLSLKALAATCGARAVVWPEEGFFLNVNTPDDLERAAKHLL
ncbi:molybdopterin-guanine dinucleotide biosynthesis protein A [Amphiplicatus metriothermophilus]|nr:molybdopterin-guanine dinucleotide biosynthesis protein A [Amphiplicatus metriothermophilus]